MMVGRQADLVVLSDTDRTFLEAQVRDIQIINRSIFRRQGPGHCRSLHVATGAVIGKC